MARIDVPHNAHRAARDEVVRRVDGILDSEKLLGFHCTRLTPGEIARVRHSGLELLSSALVRRRLDNAIAEGSLTEDLAALLWAGHQADDPNRVRKTWFVNCRSVLRDEYAVGRLFRSWGGEALYWGHEHREDTGATLRGVGVPAIVLTAIPVPRLRNSPFDDIGERSADWSEYNVRTDVNKEKLQLIGGICLEWNFIEDVLDYALFHAWEMDRDAAIETASHINGVDGKLAIIKRCVRTVKRHPEPIPSIVDTTINAVAEYKGYRNGVVHARLLDPKSDVASLSVNRGRANEVLVSNNALDGLLTRLQILSYEMVVLANALAYTFIDDSDDYNPKLEAISKIPSRYCSSPGASEAPTIAFSTSSISSGAPS